MIILGPSQSYTGIQPSLYWTFGSAVFLAVGHVLVFIPIFPDLIESIANHFPEFPEDIVADLSSSLYNGIYAMGGLLGNGSAGFVLSLFLEEAVKKEGEHLEKQNNLPEAATFMGCILFVFSFLYAYFGEALSIKKNAYILAQEEKKDERLIPLIAVQPGDQIIYHAKANFDTPKYYSIEE
jgi:hypothetical protein